MFGHLASQRVFSPGSEVGYLRATLPGQAVSRGGSSWGGISMASDILTRTKLAAALTSFVATITTPFVGLFTNNITPGIDTALGTLIEPTASWYARLAGTYGDVYDDNTGNMYCTMASLQFQYTGSDAPTQIYGYFVATLVTAGVLVTVRTAAARSVRNRESSAERSPPKYLRSTRSGSRLDRFRNSQSCLYRRAVARSIRPFC